MTVKPALNEPPSPVKAGARPYEMEGRRDIRVPLVDFQDLTGWTITCEDGANADFVRTNEQKLWGEYVGKVAFSGTSEKSGVTLRPPVPIPVKGAFDSVSAWIYGQYVGWAPDPATPAVVVTMLLKNAAGEEQSIDLARVNWAEWWLPHKKLGKVTESATLTGIRVRGMSSAEQRAIYFGALYFYKENLKPLRFQPRPSRAFAMPEQNKGLNTGPGTLPFPTSDRTIQPMCSASVTSSATRVSDKRWEFAYEDKSGKCKYVYEPATGGLGEITAYVGDRKVCVPMFGGGVEMADGQVATGKLIGSGKDNDAEFKYEIGAGESACKVEYRMRAWGKSLVIDVISSGAKATGVSLGEFREVQNPRLVLIPFLTYGASNPRVLCLGTPDKPLFASVWVDWYNSNGSVLWSSEWEKADSAKINGGVRYYPRTDGKRNDLCERIFLTISPTFEEVLPTIPNPPTPLGKIAGERLWQESWGPENYDQQHERSRVLRSYGIDKLTQCNHEITWRDGGESFTMRTNAAPGKGGDSALKKYVAEQKSLGWLSGLYTNYCDFAPVNAFWDEDIPQLTPEGEWRPGWSRCYAMKPSRAVEFDAKLAQVVHTKFGSNAAYTDVSTAVAPWAYTDYDARVPGGGTFAATFYAYGELLLHDQKTYGPTWSEGTFHWLYAGLATGNYALAYNNVDLAKEPLNVAFDLLKIHPLECDIGMGWTGWFLKDPGWKDPDKIDASIDHFIAATMAYGHLGWLVEEQYGIGRTCRSYYMLQQLQKRYALVPPEKIEYADGDNKWLSMSQAIAGGAIRDSRLHVVYGGGLHVYVNGSNNLWTIKGIDRKPVMLPPWGWYAATEKGDFLEFSALLDGHRVDYVRSPEYEYLDGRGVRTTYGGLAAKGSIAVRRVGETVELIDILGNDFIGLAGQTPMQCTAYDGNGVSLGEAQVGLAQHTTSWIQSAENARRYVLKPAPSSGTPDITISFPKDTVAPGEQLIATVRFAPGSKKPVKNVVIAADGATPILTNTTTDGLTVPITFPSTLKPGDVEWVRAATDAANGKTSEAWYVLTVVPAFGISLDSLGNGRFGIDVKSNLSGSRAPVLKADMKTDKSVFGLRTDAGNPRIITIDPPSSGGDASDVLVIQASCEGFSASREFTVKTTAENPLVWKAIAEHVPMWGYAYRGGKEIQGAGPAAGTGFTFERIKSGGVAKAGYFAHPPWVGGVGYTYGILGPMTLPDKDCEFRAFIGIKDGGGQSDGVDFSVVVLDDQGKEHRILTENWRKREWREVTADLSAFRGKTVSLKLITDVGPNDDASSDWAAWGEPRVVVKEEAVRVEVAPVEK